MILIISYNYIQIGLYANLWQWGTILWLLWLQAAFKFSSWTWVTSVNLTFRTGGTGAEMVTAPKNRASINAFHRNSEPSTTPTEVAPTPKLVFLVGILPARCSIPMESPQVWPQAPCLGLCAGASPREFSRDWKNKGAGDDVVGLWWFVMVYKRLWWFITGL